jgi:hypothetical protein
MGVRALGVVAYAVAVAGLVVYSCCIVLLVPIFFCGNIFREPQPYEQTT